jgi:hypothetical protein
MGSIWGIICNARLSGLVITASGKRKRLDSQEDLDAMVLEERDAAAGELEERTYTGTFDGCAGYCDMASISDCEGVSFNVGYGRNCMAYDVVDGQFAAEGGIAALRIAAPPTA